MFLLLLMLLGCPAERLGIPVPAQGVEAIALEDLRRDTEAWLNADRVDAGDRMAFLAERWSQMGLEPMEKGRCGQRTAVGGRPDLVGVQIDSDVHDKHRGQAVAVAMGISLAKVTHGNAMQKRGVRICVGELGVFPGPRIRISSPPGSTIDIQMDGKVEALANADRWQVPSHRVEVIVPEAQADLREIQGVTTGIAKVMLEWLDTEGVVH